MPPHTPFKSLPGQDSFMLVHAPMATTTASWLAFSCSRVTSLPMRALFFISTPRAAIWAISSSTIALGRRYSGMPYRSMPPILGMASYTVTLWPFRARK